MTPETLYLLAEVDGRVAGSGVACRSDLAGQGSLAPRVLPEARRRGVGTALLRELAAHVERIGFARAGSLVDDPGSLVVRRAFRVSARSDARSSRCARSASEPPARIAGRRRDRLRGRTAGALRPHVRARASRPSRTLAVDMPLEVSRETWEREWLTWPEGSFVALAGDEVVGCAGLLRDNDHPERAENSLTAVRRDWRRPRPRLGRSSGRRSHGRPRTGSARSTPGRRPATRNARGEREARLRHALHVHPRARPPTPAGMKRLPARTRLLRARVLPALPDLGRDGCLPRPGAALHRRSSSC